MFKPTAVAVPLLTLFLAACGGSDGGDSVTNTSDNNTNTNTGDNTNTGTDTNTGSTPEIELGSGTGESFQDGVVSLSTSVGVVGSAITVTVDAVDTNSSNSAVTTAYQYVFSSACAGLDVPTASFSQTNISSSDGNAESSYTSTGCLSDTITVQLFADGANPASATALSSATAQVTLANPALGYTDGAFRKGSAGLSPEYALVGSPVVVSVQGVDENNANALLTSQYKYTFSSSCANPASGSATASFSAAQIVSDTGLASSTYTSVGCSGSDTVTVRMFTTDADVTTATPLATATATLNLDSPALGLGEGAQFLDNVIDGTVIPLGDKKTTLTANAVNPLTLNSKINSSDYVIRWSTDCADGSFSIAQQNLGDAADIETVYSTNLTNCPANQVELNIYRKEDRSFSSPLDTISTAITVQSSTGGDSGNTGGTDNEISVLPSLGSGNGAAFNEGVLALTLDEVLVGGETVVTASAVDKNSSNTSLSDTYQYVFTSTCQAADNAEFSISQTYASGQVSSTYRNVNCPGGDVITARLFSENADISTDSAIATATATITTALPTLGNGSGFDYSDNKVAGNLDLEGETETDLSASVVNPLRANEQITSANYRVRWSTNCADASFSVEEQSLETDIVTKYRANDTTCLGTNTLSLVLFEKNNPSVTLDTINFTIEIAQGVDAKIGTGSGGTFSEGDLDISDTTISAGGTALIAVNIVDGNNSDAIITNRSYGLTIESNCAAQSPAQATFNNEEVITAQGSNVGFTYTAEGCVGSDSLTVVLYAVDNGNIDRNAELGRATGSITVASPEVGAISYEGADRTLIAIKGLGSSTLPTQAAVSFKVVDKSQNPIEGRVVEFELSNDTGGIELASTSDVTDSDGVVQAIVNSGTTHTQVAVKATVLAVGTEAAISPTNSLPISVTTGLADQDSFEIVADILNPNAASVSGTEVEITAFAADQFNNPVPDGTTVNFTAESGFIGSRCEMSGGSCSVTWISSGERPGAGDGTIDPSLNRVNEVRSGEVEFNGSHYGMTTILAYMEGEAGFTDANNNGLFDTGEAMRAVGEPVRDDNNNGGAPDQAGGRNVEFFADYDHDGVYDAAPGFYQGALCSDDAKDPTAGGNANNCSQLAFINSSLRLVQSEGNEHQIIRVYALVPDSVDDSTGTLEKIYDSESGGQLFNLPDPDATVHGGQAELYVLVQDVNGNIPPNGTTLSVSAEGYAITSSSSPVANDINEIDTDNSSFIKDEYDFGMFHQAFYSADGLKESISVTVTFGALSHEVKLTP
jgi:hypothetical protein